MPNKIKEAIADSLQDIVNAGIKTTFTQKRLNELGVKIPKTKMNLIKIKKVRKNLNLSQSVFSAGIKCQYCICKALGTRIKRAYWFNKSSIGIIIKRTTYT
jgi:hypothetical protein